MHRHGRGDTVSAAATVLRGAGTRRPDLKVFICGRVSVSPLLIRRAAQYFDQAVVTRAHGCTEVPVTTIGAPRREETDYAARERGGADNDQLDYNLAVLLAGLERLLTTKPRQW